MYEKGVTPKLLAKKWQKVIDYPKYNKIESPIIRENLAVMLESTTRHLNETVLASLAGGGTTPGDGTLGDDFPKLAIPLLRRVMPGLIANELVGVQPMTGPVGLAFAIRFAYGAGSGDPTGVAEGAADEAIWNMSKATVTGTSSKVSFGDAPNENWTSGVQDMSLFIAQEQLSAGTRKLRAAFSLEAAQDLKALHNIDVDNELTNLLTYEIQAEIEQELIYTMIKLGAANVSATAGGVNIPASYTTAQVNAAEVGAVGIHSVSAGASANYDNNEFYMYRGVWTVISKAMNAIAVQTRRGPANWLICSPKVLTALQSITNFLITPVPNDVDFANVAAKKVGFINNGRTAVYLDLFNTLQYYPSATAGGTQPSSKPEYCLIGYKGGSELDAGLFYCPYVPILLVRAQDPNTFAPKLGVMSRYSIAKSLLGSYRYYYLLRFDFAGTNLA